MSTIHIARLTNRRELYYDPTDRSPVIRGPGATGYQPSELRHALDYRELKDSVRRLWDEYKADGKGPLMASGPRCALLAAALQLNVDLPERERNYALEVVT